MRKKDDQGNEVGGYMDPVKRNVKAIRLRGERSDGLFMPLSSLKDFCNVEDLKVGDRITTLNGYVICEKYIPRTNRPRRNAQNTKKKTKTILFPLFKEHADTEQLDYNWGEIRKGDLCILTLKMHGTSQRTAYLPKENTGLRKLLRLPKKYDIVTGTRRVVLENIDNSTTGGYYKDDGFRKQWHDFFKGKLIKGEEVFYEVVGYTEKDKPIMGDGNNKK